MQLDTFTRAYLACALWSSTDEDGEPLDGAYDLDDLAPCALARAIDDCDDFRERADWYATDAAEFWTDEGGGHDFWLTRNGHGAGFWDRYSGGCEGEREGERLTDLSKTYGAADLYVGDDGLLYFI